MPPEVLHRCRDCRGYTVKTRGDRCACCHRTYVYNLPDPPELVAPPSKLGPPLETLTRELLART